MLGGGAMTGAITTNSTFDGRDVATDGTKLDGIEASATADQTDAEIRAAVEAASDSNVFSDDDHSKLNAIEASATADQTASEILTLMKTVDGAGSGLDADTLDGNSTAYFTAYTDTAIANLSDSAPGTLDTLNELAAALGDDANFSATVTSSIATKMPLAGGAFSGAVTTNSTFDGRDVATDGAKLDGIEAGSNVTDTANVTSAGALMDSELTGIAHVKSLNQALTTSSSPNFTAVTATNFNGEATTAKYADLAERYAADATYEEGTVVMFGGDMEVTASHGYGSMKIAGVVSMKPAFAMNEEAGSNDTHPYIALQGRVPCKVKGDVAKGDILVASDDSGFATKWMDADSDPRMTAYIGIAISHAVDGMVEVKVGK